MFELNFINEIYLITALVVIVMFVLTVAKRNNAYRNRAIIWMAITDYRLALYSLGKKDAYVSVNDMESYEKTVFRLFDWGYKNILSPDKFEIINHYIDERRKYKI